MNARVVILPTAPAVLGKIMKHLAAGQFLGTAIQFPRALYHLLTCSAGDKVSIEVLGDVATEYASGQVITEEDKSSVNSNPVTDHSTDLWKTFSNWVNAIISGDLDINKTKFILYTNQAGRSALVNTFHKASNNDEAECACKEAERKLKKVDDKHPIWPYYHSVTTTHRSLFLAIMQRFELQVGEGTGAGDVKKEMLNRHYPKHYVDFLFHKLSGWLQSAVMEAIMQGIPAVITWESLDEELQPLLRTAYYKELYDFTRDYPPTTAQKKKERTEMPMYLKQMEIIGCKEDELMEAVTEYISARVNREKWIETETIDEAIAEKFEGNLTAFWKNTMKAVPIANKMATDEEHGQLVLATCRSRQELIREQVPPSSMIAGTYHALVKAGQCGWHKEWESKCK